MRHPESGPTGRQGTVQQLQMPCNRAAVRSPATGDPYYSDGVRLSEVGIQALVEAMSGSLLQARSGSRASGRPVAYARRTWSHRWWHRTARSALLQQRPVHVARPLSRSLWQDGGWRPDKQGLIAQAALPSAIGRHMPRCARRGTSTRRDGSCCSSSGAASPAWRTSKDF